MWFYMVLLSHKKKKMMMMTGETVSSIHKIFFKRQTTSHLAAMVYTYKTLIIPNILHA